MRQIIDANCLASALLEKYLKSNSKNMAVLTEIAGMEMYKGDPLKNICHSIKVLCQYPTQVIVLKGARQIIKENQTPSILNLELFIDKDQTEHFSEFCEVIKQAENGNPNAITAIVTLGKNAAAEMKRLRQDAIKTAEGMAIAIDGFNPKHLKILRKQDPIPKDLADKLIKDIFVLTALLIRKHPDTTQVPTAQELRNTYIFRYSLCSYLLELDWLERGGLNKVNPDRLRNDLIDMSYAAYATLFDGIISKDIKLNRIYQMANYFINHVFK